MKSIDLSKFTKIIIADQLQQSENYSNKKKARKADLFCLKEISLDV